MGGLLRIDSKRSSLRSLSKASKMATTPGHILSRFFLFFLTTSVLVLVLLQLRAFKDPSSATSAAISPLLHEWEKYIHTLPPPEPEWEQPICSKEKDESTAKLESALARLRATTEFLPLKDLRFASKPMTGHTWFMSSLNDSLSPEDVAEHFHFPSQNDTRLLCIAGASQSNGTHNAYALAWPDALPDGARVLPGLTFVSDSYYDYRNPWHSLAAMVPFVGWHKWRECVRPARWVLFHWGEVRTGLGPWVKQIVQAAIGVQDVVIETLDYKPQEERPVSCFQEAIVFRHNIGSIPKLKRREVYDMIRCKARKACNVTADVKGNGADVRLTLFLRSATRSFRNESGIIDIFRKECAKVIGCRMIISRPENQTLCDQVKLMSNTDVLVSQHGAQLTNMIFMDKNSSVMEFFPKGWKELAGVGQFVYRWIASWSGMRHKGPWNDALEEDAGKYKEGVKCPYHPRDPRCFTLYKDGQVGHNETYLVRWAGEVLKQAKEWKMEILKGGTSSAGGSTEDECPCS